MSEDHLADEIRRTQGMEPPSPPEHGVRIERRRGRREPPRTLADAHAIVQAIARRRVENDRWVRRWRTVERGFYLFALVGAYLLYYLIDKMIEALSLPGIPF